MQNHSQHMPFAKDHSKESAGQWQQQLLLHLMCLGMLLPTAAQAIISGIAGLRFLFLKVTGRLQTNWSEGSRMVVTRQIFKQLWQGFLIILVAQLILTFCQTARALFMGKSIWASFIPYIRLLGKQGLYGSLLVLTFIWDTRRPTPGAKQAATIHPAVFLVTTILLGIYMLAQRHWGWDWVHGWNARLGEHRFAYGVYRASGFMGHPLSLAYNSVVLTLMSFSQGLWLWQRKERSAWIWWSLCAASLGLIELTGSRFPMVLAAGLIILSLGISLKEGHWKRWLLLASLALLVLCAGFLLFNLDSNIEGRWQELVNPQIPWEERFDRLVFWKVHSLMFWDHPWLGTGLADYDWRLLDYYDQAGYTHIERKYAAHNIFLQTLADSGLCGAAVLVLMLGVWLRAAICVQRQCRHQGLLLIWLGTVLGGLMQNNLRDSEYLYALWTSLGFCCTCLLAWGMHLEPDCRSDFKDHQSRADIQDCSKDVRRSNAGFAPDQG